MRRVRDLQPYVGKEIEAKIIELDKNRNNVVLSRRAWLEQTQSEVRHDVPQHAAARARSATASCPRIVNFGAFVDLGGVDGLVHVSELSWKHIDHPGEVVEVGQEVTVEVLDVDMDRERVSLSLKATQEDPWQQFARTHQIGQVVPGRVTKLVPFGAFVRVEEGIEGLVHISELADRHVEIPEQVVQVGDEIFVKVIDIDLDRRRISPVAQAGQRGHDRRGRSATTSTRPRTACAADLRRAGQPRVPGRASTRTPASGWKGFDAQREEWEQQYAEARSLVRGPPAARSPRPATRPKKRPRMANLAAAQATPKRPLPAARPHRPAAKTRTPRRAPSPRTKRSRHCATSCPAARANKLPGGSVGALTRSREDTAGAGRYGPSPAPARLA